LKLQGVDCKFLNFGIKIEKLLKLQGLKLDFSIEKKKKKKKSSLQDEAG
jgi:hypothetical protein